MAFADDVLCAGAGMRAGVGPVWVSSPTRWTGDAGVCPRCDGAVTHAGVRWACSACGLARPDGDWTLVDDDGAATVHSPDGGTTSLDLQLPGHANRLNAVFALAVGAELGVDPAVAAARLRGLAQVGGRYRTVARPGGTTRLLLAKNPAGWAQVLDLLDEGPPRPVVVAVNAREADGRDVSWLWDVPFERLAVIRWSPRGSGPVTSRCAWPTRAWPTAWPTTPSRRPATPSARSTSSGTTRPSTTPPGR